MTQSQCDQPHVFFDSLTSFPSGQQFLDSSTSSPSTLLNINIMDTHTYTGSTDANVSNFDRISLLERSIFSNFLCCGLHLADFHALLEHFEEDHIVVVNPNGRRVYPPGGLSSVALHPRSHTLASTSPSSSPSSPMTSFSTSPPSPPSSIIPPTPLSPKSSIADPGNKDRENQLSKPCIPIVYTPFMPSALGDPSETTGIVSALEPDFDIPHHYPDGFSESPCNADLDDAALSDPGPLDLVTNTTPTYLLDTSNAEFIKQIHTKRSSVTLVKSVIGRRSTTPRVGSNFEEGSDVGLKLALEIASPITKNKYRIRVGSQGISKKREKTYRCPEPRCSKSYLNPNGLKYHLEKGTCKINGASDINTPLSLTPLDVVDNPGIPQDLNHQGRLNDDPQKTSSPVPDSGNRLGAVSNPRHTMPIISPVPIRYRAPLWSGHQNQLSRSTLVQCIQ